MLQRYQNLKFGDFIVSKLQKHQLWIHEQVFESRIDFVIEHLQLNQFGQHWHVFQRSDPTVVERQKLNIFKFLQIQFVRFSELTFFVTAIDDKIGEFRLVFEPRLPNAPCNPFFNLSVTQLFIIKDPFNLFIPA